MTARLIALALFVVTLGVYAQVGGHEFLNWDDQLYVTDNALVQRGLTWAGVEWAFSNVLTANWHPLTWLSHMLDVELFGASSGAHHQVNAVLHALNAVLLFAVLRRMTAATWASALVAALFALHPLRVESVAWVSERKDLLAGLFWILGMAAYAAYVERRTALRYLAIVAALVLSLLAKPMAVTLPFALLLLDAWPLGRTRTEPLRKLVLEKVPMIAVVAVMSGVALWTQSAGGALSGVENVSIGDRIANALVSWVAYPLDTVWPTGLAFYYPHPAILDPEFSMASPIVIGCAVVLVAITALAIRTRAGAPWFAIGWFWYLGTTLPVIGIVQVGSQARADRYTYIPAIGLAIVVAWGVRAVWLRRPATRPALAAAIGAVLLALSVLTWRQIATWQDNEALYRHALAVTEDNYRAHTNLGSELGERGDLEGAGAHLEAALRINDEFAAAHVNMALLRKRQGESGAARSHYERALELAPRDVPALYGLGTLELQSGNAPRGAELLERVLAVDPTHVGACFNLGVLALQRRDTATARSRFERVLELDPKHEQARSLMARLPR